MKNTTQTLLLVLSTLLLLVSATVSAQGQPPSANNANFAGVWNTITDKGEKLVITLRHNPSDFSVVNGSYRILGDVTDKPLDGALKGTAKNNVLRFTWSSDQGRRAGRFTISADGQSIEGTFSATKNPDDTSGGTWKGTRAPNFAGAWQANFGGSILTMIFQQTGDRVSGQLNANSPELGVIRDGMVVDNTLRFTVLRRVPNVAHFVEQQVGIGELVMDAGGKSFKGTVLGVPTSGTLIAR
jgi:hypothetical protein